MPKPVETPNMDINESETNNNNSVNNNNGNTQLEQDDYQWFRISDSSVELIIDPELELFNNGSPYVYMLFYESLSECNLSEQDKEKLVFEERRKYKIFQNEVRMNSNRTAANKSNIINPFVMLNSTVTQNNNIYRSELRSRNTSVVDEDDVE